MTNKLVQKTEKGEFPEVEPKDYKSEVDLTKPLENEDIINILYLVNDVYNNETVVFMYKGKKYTTKDLKKLEGQTGKLEILVDAMVAVSKSDDLKKTLQRNYNLDAEDCAEGLKEYIETGLGYNS